MKNLLENQNTAGQFIWVVFIRLVGIIMIVAPLYLPIRSYFLETKVNVVLTTQDVWLIAFGILLSSGGKHIGILLNNFGKASTALIDKVTK